MRPRNASRSPAAASSKRQDLPELVDHLVHHHGSRSIKTRGAVSLCHHSAAAPGYSALSYMMMSAMMAAGRIRSQSRTLAEGPLHGPGGTVPSAAVALRHQQRSSRRVARSNICFVLLNHQSDAILQRDLHLGLALAFNSELWPS